MDGQRGGLSCNEIPSTFVVEMRERGQPIPQIENWWLRLARSLVANDARDLSTLGADLAKRLDKKQPFDKGTLSRFIKGEGSVTIQLIQSLCAEFTRLPPPVFFPASYEEAVQMMALQERYARRVGNDDAPEGVVTAMPVDDGRRRGKRVVATAITAITAKRRNSGR